MDKCEKDEDGVVRDPLTDEEIDPEYLVSFVDGKRFCFHIDSLYRATRKKLVNPFTNNPLPSKVVQALSDYESLTKLSYTLDNTKYSEDGLLTLGDFYWVLLNKVHREPLNFISNTNFEDADERLLLDLDLNSSLYDTYGNFVELKTVRSDNTEAQLRNLLSFSSERRGVNVNIASVIARILEEEAVSKFEEAPVEFAESGVIDIAVDPLDNIGDTWLSFLMAMRVSPFDLDVVDEFGRPIYYHGLDNNTEAEFGSEPNIYSVPVGNLRMTRKYFHYLYYTRNLVGYRDYYQTISLKDAVESADAQTIRAIMESKSYTVSELISALTYLCTERNYNPALVAPLLRSGIWQIKDEYYSWDVDYAKLYKPTLFLLTSPLAVDIIRIYLNAVDKMAARNAFLKFDIGELRPTLLAFLVLAGPLTSPMPEEDRKISKVSLPVFSAKGEGVVKSTIESRKGDPLILLIIGDVDSAIESLKKEDALMITIACVYLGLWSDLQDVVKSGKVGFESLLATARYVVFKDKDMVDEFLSYSGYKSALISELLTENIDNVEIISWLLTLDFDTRIIKDVIPMATNREVKEMLDNYVVESFSDYSSGELGEFSDYSE